MEKNLLLSPMLETLPDFSGVIPAAYENLKTVL